MAAEELTAYYAKLTEKYPLVSIEDGLHEDDWEGWAHLTNVLNNSLMTCRHQHDTPATGYRQRNRKLYSRKGESNWVVIRNA